MILHEVEFHVVKNQFEMPNWNPNFVSYNEWKSWFLRYIFFQITANFDCNYTIMIDLASNGIPSVVINQSEKCNYDQISVRINKIRTIFLSLSGTTEASLFNELGYVSW